MDKYKIKCKITGEEVLIRDFSDYLKNNHGLSAKIYFQTYENKKDLFDGCDIKFKSLEQYILCDFNSKINFKKWIRNQPLNESQEYILNKLRTYCCIKELEYAMPESVISTISCLLPISYIEKYLKKSYTDLCKDAGLKSNYNYSKNFISSLHVNNISEIIIDTREQKPFIFPDDIKIINSKLEFGDYASPADVKVSIERKSRVDFLNTLSQGFDRFKREIERSNKLNGYIIIITECSLNDILYKNNFYGKASGEFIAHRIRCLNKDYQNIQFVFAKDKKLATLYALEFLKLGGQVKTLDLQYYINNYELNSR